MHVSAMPVARPRAMRFFVGLAVIMVAFMAVGFGPSLYLRPVLGTVDRFGPSLPLHLLVHGAALTAWYLLFVVQTLLVRTGRRDLHRRLGFMGGVVAIAVVVSSMITLRLLVARLGAGGNQLPSRVVGVVVSDFCLLVAFTLLVTAAVHFRRQPETHKRLMLLASVFLLGPAFAVGRPIGRTLAPLLPNGLLPSTVFTVLSIGALICHDAATKKRIEPATLWGSVAIAVAIGATRVMLFGPWGSAFARWLGGLGS